MSSPAGPKAPEPIPILAIALAPELKQKLVKALPAASFLDVSYDMEKLLEPLNPLPAIVIASAPPAEVSPSEIAQLLRGVYPHAKIFLVAETKQAFDRKNLIKNGFSEVFFLPIDAQNLFQTLQETLALLGSAEKVYRNVKVLDVAADTVLDFNTYLYMPANNKHVKFSSAGDAISPDRVERLKAHSVSSLSIPVEEMKSFYSYTASVLKNINKNSGLSETERGERLEGAVRELITGLFSDTATSTEQGKAAVSDLQGIVKSYIADTSPAKAGWYNRFLAVTAQSSNTYSKAAATSTFASLFAIGIGVKEVDDIALAGLLHDLGMAKVPLDVQNTPEAEWLPVDRDVFESHPEASLEMIRDRKLVVSEMVHKIILQHHENYNGTGFPKKVTGDRICIGAQLMQIADLVYAKTLPQANKKQVTPKQALEALLAENLGDPGKVKINPDLLKKILTLFADAK